MEKITDKYFINYCFKMEDRLPVFNEFFLPLENKVATILSVEDFCFYANPVNHMKYYAGIPNVNIKEFSPEHLIDEDALSIYLNDILDYNVTTKFIIALKSIYDFKKKLHMLVKNTTFLETPSISNSIIADLPIECVPIQYISSVSAGSIYSIKDEVDFTELFQGQPPKNKDVVFWVDRILEKYNILKSIINRIDTFNSNNIDDLEF